MKKIISKTQLLIVVLILVFAGCQKQENNEFFQEFQKYESLYSLQLQKLNVRTNNEQMIAEIKDNLSTEANAFLNEIIAKAYDFVDVLSFTNQINAIENNIKSELIGSEIDILLTVTSIMKHSALFWAPENLGGSGIGYSVLQEIEKNYWNSEKGARPKPSLKKVVGEALVADGISEGIGMLGVAVTIAVAGVISGPAGWAALYVTFGESVISSGVQAFLTYYRG